MKQGITIERTYDLHDRPIVRITKRRGRLSLEEVGDLLRHEGFGRGPDVKFCVSDFRQSQEWRWKAGRILA